MRCANKSLVAGRRRCSVEWPLMVWAPVPDQRHFRKRWVFRTTHQRWRIFGQKGMYDGDQKSDIIGGVTSNGFELSWDLWRVVRCEETRRKTSWSYQTYTLWCVVFFDIYFSTMMQLVRFVAVTIKLRWQNALEWKLFLGCGWSVDEAVYDANRTAMSWWRMHIYTQPGGKLQLVAGRAGCWIANNNEDPACLHQPSWRRTYLAHALNRSYIYSYGLLWYDMLVMTDGARRSVDTSFIVS